MTLTEKEVQLFYRLQFQILNFILGNTHKDIIVNTIQEYYDLPQNLKYKIRNILWDNLDWIDKYLIYGDHNLKDEEKLIVKQWKLRIKDQFLLERILKKHSIFISGDIVYGVVGLIDEIEDLFSKSRLPLYVETVLLPFKDKIIYDGLIAEYSISFGKGIRDLFKSTYLLAKNSNSIITSLA